MNKLEKYVSPVSNKVAGWYWTARSMYVGFGKCRLSDWLSLTSRSSEWNKEHVRMRKFFDSRRRFDTFCGEDLFTFPEVLVESAKFSDYELRHTIASFIDIATAGSLIRKYGRDTLRIIEVKEIAKDICPNEVGLFSRLGVFHNQFYISEVKRFLDWHESISREEQEEFWPWYAQSDISRQRIMDIHPSHYKGLIQRGDDVSSDIVLYSHIADHSKRSIPEILSLPQSDLEKIVTLWDKLDHSPEIDNFYTGITGALEQDILLSWLEHVLEQIDGDAIGGSNYRGAAA